jgi:DNA-binding response OmpR family regulator
MVNKEHASIMVIEKNHRNLELMIAFLNQHGYRTLPVSVLNDELDVIIANESSLQLALVDISGYDSSIWEWCEKIRIQGVQLLILSQRQSIELTNESIKHGASGVLIKPLVMKELAALIRGLIDEE